MTAPPDASAPQSPARRRRQFSLAWLIVAVLTLGPILGIGGPVAVQIIRELRTPRPLPPAVVPAATFESMPMDYYESGETPLD